MTRVDIANRTLTILKKERIKNLETTSPEARACKTFIDDAFRDVLMYCLWSFAIGISDLTEDEVTTNNWSEKWSYLFTLPTDCLIAEYLEYGYEYEIIGGILYTDTSEATLIYRKDLTPASDAATLSTPNYLAIPLAWALARRVAPILAPEAMEIVEAKYRQALLEAEAHDAYHSASKPVPGEQI